MSAVIVQSEPSIDHNYITVFTQHGPVGKEFDVNDDGQVTKKSNILFFGTGVKVHVPDPDAFSAVLRDVSRSNNKVIMLGFIAGIDSNEVFELTKKSDFMDRQGLDRRHRGDIDSFFIDHVTGVKVAARLKRAVTPSSWMLIDRDKTEGMPDWMTALSRELWLDEMAKLLPGLREAGKVISGSSSARMIVNGQQQYSNNMHCYVQVKDPYDIERVGSSMLINSFDEELGYRKPIGGKGVSVPWSIFDPTTFSRERLNYESSPLSFSQHITIAEADIDVIPGGVIDTSFVRSPVGERHGMELHQAGGGGCGYMIHDRLSLTLNAIIETKDHDFMTIREWRDGGYGHTRMQSPTRPDSVSWNAYMDRHTNGELLCFDNGIRVKYTVRADVNELLAGVNLQMGAAQVGGDNLTGEPDIHANTTEGVVPVDVSYTVIDPYTQFLLTVNGIDPNNIKMQENFVYAVVRGGMSDMEVGRIIENLKDKVGAKREINALLKRCKSEYRTEMGQQMIEQKKAEIAAGVSVGSSAIFAQPLDTEIEHECFPETAVKEDGRTVVVKSTINNLVYMLGVYGINVRYNQITKRPLIEHSQFSTEGDGDQREENAVTHIIDRVRYNMLSGFKDNTIMAQMNSIAMSNEYNPVVDYIGQIPWDGVDRLPEFCRLIGVSDQHIQLRDYVMRKWLVQAVAAADGATLTPLAYHSPDGNLAKPKYEYVLILQGVQGLQKTKFFNDMLPVGLRKHFKEGVLLDPSSKDSVSLFISHWINELGELDATFTKSDVSHLKAFLSNSTDMYRKPFGKVDSSYRRRSVACASVNPKHFLKDVTGNRRFWVVPAISIKLPEQVNMDLDQLWAQVWSLYVGGEAWWPTPQWQVYIDNFASESTYMTVAEESIAIKLKWAFGDFTDETTVAGEEMFAKDIADKLNQQNNDTRLDARAVSNVLRKINRDANGEARIAGKTHGATRWKMPLLVGRPVTGM